MEISNQILTRRFEELNQWQVEQRKILSDRQDTQRKIFNLEHKKIYEMLDIIHSPVRCESENCQNEGHTKVSFVKEKSEITNEFPNINENLEPTVKRKFLRRGEGLKTRFNIDPEKLRLHNLPQYKLSHHYRHLNKNMSAKNVLDGYTQINELKQPVEPSKREINSRHIFKFSNTSKEPDSETKKLDQVIKERLTEGDKKGNRIDLNSKVEVVGGESMDSARKIYPKSWSTVLDSNNIVPVEVGRLRSNSCDSILQSSCKLENLSIFQLIKQKTGSTSLNSSVIEALVDYNNFNDTNESSPTNSLDQINSSVKLFPYTKSECLDSCNSSQISDEELSFQPSKSNIHVRFADENRYESMDRCDENTSAIKDVCDKAQEFNEVVLENKDQDQLDSTSKEILEHYNLVKMRLQELEREIQIFKINNLNLLKAKQENELEKSHFMQERQEMIEKLDHDKMQLEMYLHDEKMKIEDEKRKLMTQINSQKLNAMSRERNEIKKLKIEIENLQTELKNQKQTHFASQVRLRTKIRVLEKDQKALRDEINVLTTENKRLQNENLQLGRQNNNKILGEINRNISNMAPKLITNGKIKVRSAKSAKLFSPALNKSKEKSYNTKTHKENRPSTTESTISAASENNCDLFNDQSVPDIIDMGEDNLSLPLDEKKSGLKRVVVNPDGSKDIVFSNGNLKKVSADGMIVRMLYFNKDIKETDINEGIVKYYYAATNTWHTSYLDGLEIIEFPNGQTEHRFKNGIIEVHFPNNSIKIIYPADELKVEEWRLPDGTNLIHMKNGDRILMLPNGQKETHSAFSKRREFLDGTVKLVYPDGSQETRYSNGRFRLKDKDGNLVMDTENTRFKFANID